MPIIEIATHVGEIIVAHYIQEEVWTRQILHRFFPPDNFKSRLVQVIHDTIIDYEKQHPIKESDDKFPFYYSPEILEKLTKHILFKTKQSTSITQSFTNNSQYETPTKEELLDFFELFTAKVKNDRKLIKLDIDENYKTEIFEISSAIAHIKKEIEGISEQITQLSSIILKDDSNTIDDLKVLLLNNYNNQLDIIQDSINRFNPKSALDNVIKFEEQINNEGRITNRIKAKISFLKYKCFIEIGSFNLALKNIQQANQLDQENFLYKEKYCRTEFNFGNRDNSFVLSEELLKVDPLNSTANAVKLVQNFPDSIIENIPDNFKEDRNFKLLLTNEFIIHNKHEELYRLFQSELATRDFNEALTNENHAFFGTISTIFLNRALTKTLNISFELLNPNLSKDEDLKKANFLLEKYAEFFERTEKYKYIIHHLYCLHYSRYLLTGKSNHVHEMLKSYHLLGEEKKGMDISSLVCCLAQVGEAKSAIQLMEQFEIGKGLNLLTLLSSLYLFVGEKNKAMELSKRFMEEVSVIEEGNLGFVIQHLFNFCDSDTERENVFKSLQFKDKFKSEVVETILESYSNVKNERKNRELFANKLYNIYCEAETISPVYAEKIAIYLSICEHFNEANEVLKGIISFQRESQNLKLFIINLYRLKTENVELLRYLKNWREHFNIDFELLEREVSLLLAIPDWVEVEKVTLYALQFQPKNLFISLHYILSLAKQKKKIEAKQALTPLLKENIPTQLIYEYARIANEIEEPELAIELLYSPANDKENKIARETFFKNYALLSEALKKDELLLANEGTWGVFEVDGSIVTHQIIENNPIGKLFFNKPKGAIEQHLIPFTEKKQSIKLVKIMDKYEALFGEISEEVFSGNSTGMNIHSIHFESPKQFESLVKEMVGAQGTKFKLFSDDVIDKFRNSETPFSALVRQVFNDKPIDAYHYCISNTFRVLPKFVFKNFKLNQSLTFVIDYTSLLLFASLTYDLKISFDKKFLISSFVIEHIEQELYEVEHSPAPELSLNITLENVRPQFYHKDYKTNRIKFFKRLLIWINTNCETRIVPEKLDIVRQLDEKESLHEPYFKYIIDTAHLANTENAVLISDDSMFMKLLYPSGHLINSEAFISHKFPDHYREIIIPFLLDKNYLGITIYGENLKTEFDKSYGLEHSSYLKCLQNLNPLISTSQFGWQGVLDFIKFIYLKPLLPEHKSRIVQQVLSAWLIGINDQALSKIYDIIKTYISFSFRLLPQYLEAVHRDFEDAIAVTRKEN